MSKDRDWILFTEDRPTVPVYAGYTPAETRRALKRKEEPGYHGTFTGARRYVLKTFASTQSQLMKNRVARYLASAECPECHGKRLRRVDGSAVWVEVTASGVELSAVPGWMTDFAQLMFGLILGARYERAFFARHGAGFHIGFSDIARGGWRTILTKGYITALDVVYTKEAFDIGRFVLGKAWQTADEAQRRREEAERRNQAEAMVYSTERTLEEYAQHVPAAEQAFAEVRSRGADCAE